MTPKKEQGVKRDEWNNNVPVGFTRQEDRRDNYLTCKRAKKAPIVGEVRAVERPPECTWCENASADAASLREVVPNQRQEGPDQDQSHEGLNPDRRKGGDVLPLGPRRDVCSAARKKQTVDADRFAQSARSTTESYSNFVVRRDQLSAKMLAAAAWPSGSRKILTARGRARSMPCTA